MDEPTPDDSGETTAKRALRRAGVHFVKAAIEVVAGLEVLIDEMRGSERQAPSGDKPARQHIEIDDEPDGPPPAAGESDPAES
jgi:hypothetical protein